MEKFVTFEKGARKIIGEFKTEREAITDAWGRNLFAHMQGWPQRYGAEYRTLAVRLGVKG